MDSTNSSTTSTISTTPSIPEISSTSTCEAGYYVQADPDVAGIGVILAFLITAFLSFALATLTFLYVDNAVPKEAETPLDRLVIKIARKPFLKEGRLPWTVNRDLMQQVCLMLGDQQLVTGASILIVCFSTHLDITQYHFIIGATLSFASFATFQATAIASGELIRDSELKKAWRFPWFCIIIVMATLSSYVVMDENFLVPGQWGLSTQCVLDHLGTYSPGSVVRLVLWTIVAADGVMSMAKFFWPKLPLVTIYDHFWFAIPALPLQAISLINKYFLKNGHGKGRRTIGFILQAPLIVSFWIVFALFEVWYSVNFDLFRTYLILVVSTWGVYSLRREVKDSDYLQGEEDSWGFGQILPLLLLALPLFQSIETVFGEKESKPISGPSPEKQANSSSTQPAHQAHGTTQTPLQPSTFLSQHIQIKSSQPDHHPVDQIAPASNASVHSAPPSLREQPIRAITRRFTTLNAAGDRRGNANAGLSQNPNTTVISRDLHSINVFIRILYQDNLSIKEIEQAMYTDEILSPFNVFILFTLVALYATVTWACFYYDFVI